MMKKFYKLFLSVFGFYCLQSSLFGQSVNLDSFTDVQLLNVQNCAVVQVNASWNFKNRLEIEKLKDCYIAELDLTNKQIGVVIQREWNIKVVPTIIIFENGKEVKRFEPGISMKFDEDSVLTEIRKEIR